VAVEVTGDGLVAAEARRLLEEEGRLAAGDDPPDAIVETTGDPAAIAAATARVADMGTVALAGEPLGRTLSLDVYTDVHVRGLRLVGIGRPEAGSDVAAPRDCLATLEDGTGGSASARWHRVAGEDAA
jgi:threonine dehydrogenase-like Zn-dependent dehydrogenase